MCQDEWLPQESRREEREGRRGRGKGWKEKMTARKSVHLPHKLTLRFTMPFFCTGR